MSPFLEIPLCLQNSEGEEKQTVGRIQPNDISYYYPGFNWGTVIVMKQGSSFLTTLKYEELDAALMSYDKFVKSNTGKFGNLILHKKPALHVTS
jgi:hypothetical protein